jgi:hypothetical protein
LKFAEWSQTRRRADLVFTAYYMPKAFSIFRLLPVKARMIFQHRSHQFLVVRRQV